MGLFLDRGVQNSTVKGSVFNDIGGSAIQLGRVNIVDQQPAAGNKVLGNVVADNVITNAAAEYQDQDGIALGFTYGTTVSHNYLADLPYSAISVGLGWDDSSYSGNIAVTGNEIANYAELSTLNDGGAIYTNTAMAASPRSTMSGNYVHNDTAKFSEDLYFDASSANWDVTGNVLDTANPYIIVQACCNVAATGMSVTNNYATTSMYGTPPAGTVVSGNQENLTTFPAAALAIEASAGLEPAYRSLTPSFVINDADHTISYGGSGWSYSTQRDLGDYGDDIHVTSNANDYLIVPFTGSGISLIGERLPTPYNASLEVYIDGVDEGTASPTPAAGSRGDVQQVLYSVTGLAPGKHAIGFINKTAVPFAVDGFVLQQPGTVANDDNSATSYSNGWTHPTGRGLGDVNDDVHTTSTSGASVIYNFTGSGVTVLSPRTPTASPAHVYVDGNDEGVMSPTTSSSNAPQQVAYSITGLAPGSHAVGLVTTTANPFSVDAFVVEPSRTLYNDTAASFSYAGTWSYSSNAGYGDYNNDVHYTSAADSAVTFAFTGSSATLLNLRYSTNGPLEVYVDGVDQGAVNPPTSGGTAALQPAYSIDGLRPGNHHLTIVNKTAVMFQVDAFTVR